jgi:hypothetical protein
VSEKHFLSDQIVDLNHFCINLIACTYHKNQSSSLLLEFSDIHTDSRHIYVYKDIFNIACYLDSKAKYHKLAVTKGRYHNLKLIVKLKVMLNSIVKTNFRQQQTCYVIISYPV